jgi:DNA-binding LytR/AlgR family response regulator
MPEAILYISAEENYVNIYYTDNGRVKSYVLRSSMKALDELCQDHGLIRCHRSYYINPAHVKVLRKDREGLVHAELDVTDVMDIPVTKRYYDRLSELL